MSPTRPMTACSCGATENRTTEGGGIGGSSAAAIAADKSQAHVLIEKGGEDSLKRLMLLIAAGSLWLFLAAVPVFADGGPHVSAINNGTGNGGATLAADSCAGCHRAHTAQGEFLLKDSGGIATCTSCHGASGLGATTDVENGIQYVLGTSPIRTGTTLGFLRSGGFVTARIGSGEAFRVALPRDGTAVRQLAKVPVRTAGSQPVTSAHLPNIGGVIAGGGRRCLGQRSRQYDGVRRPHGRRRVRHVPQPPWERRVPHPQPHPRSGRNGRRPVRPGSRGGTGHRRAGPRRRRQPQLHHHPDQRRHRDAHGEPGGGPRPARNGRRLLPAKGPVERHERRVQRRAERPVRDLLPRRSPPGASRATRATSARAGTWRSRTRSTSTATPQLRRPGTASRATWHTVPTRR